MSSRYQQMDAARAARAARQRRRRRQDNVISWLVALAVGVIPALGPFIAGVVLRWVLQPQAFSGAYRIGDVCFYVALLVWFLSTIIFRGVLEAAA